MGDYKAFSRTSEALLELLRAHLVPEVVQNADGILLCSPCDKGDASLGIHLYDIQESDEFRVSGMMMKEGDVQAYPSAYLSLYYMITAYSGSDVKYREMERQRVLGRVAQVLRDYHVLFEGTTQAGVNLEMVRLQAEEKMKLWNVANQAYQLSLFYKVAPVELESTKEKKITRVGVLDVTAVERE